MKFQKTVLALKTQKVTVIMLTLAFKIPKSSVQNVTNGKTANKFYEMDPRTGYLN